MDQHIHNQKWLKQTRKDLRNHSTSAEAVLWKYLQRSQLGQKIRRQHSVGGCVLDFYCPESRLNVELDGRHHFTEEGIIKDKKRDKFLEKYNIRVVRFENSDVFDKLPDVLMIIKKNFI